MANKVPVDFFFFFFFKLIKGVRATKFRPADARFATTLGVGEHPYSVAGTAAAPTSHPKIEYTREVKGRKGRKKICMYRGERTSQTRNRSKIKKKQERDRSLDRRMNELNELNNP